MKITEDMAEVILGALQVSQDEGIWGIIDFDKDDQNRYLYAGKELLNILHQLHPDIVKKYKWLRF